MVDDPFTVLDEPDAETEGQVFADPRLLERAVKRMKGLVKGNGVDIEQVMLGDMNRVFQYRFGARVMVKLVPKYGIRMEPGKNMAAELATSQEDLQRKIHNIVLDTRTQPEKRQQVVDFIFSRTDKGFGIKDQAVTFRTLACDFVLHEQCAACSHSGKILCSQCRGKGVSTCPICRGGRQSACHKCGGVGRMQTPQGLASCDQCRATGKIPCSRCGAMGQIKCRSCAASGTTPCQKCSGMGWMSHLAHVEIQGQIQFSFDRDGLPPLLVTLIEERGSFLVSKGDIEVTLRSQSALSSSLSSPSVSISGRETEDSIVLEYDVTCPYGAIDFDIGNKTIPAMLLGWQSRLIDTPSFLEEMTKTGIEALREAAGNKGNHVEFLRRAARFAIWRELISQVLVSGNLRKVCGVMLNRYSAGVSRNCMQQMVVCADQSVRLVTRRVRYLGLIGGLALYAVVASWYFLFDGRRSISDSFGESAPSSLIIGVDTLLPVLGVVLGTVSGQVAAILRQKSVFSGIVDDAVLRAHLPRAGKMVWWALFGAVILPAVILAYGVFQEIGDLPDWLTRLMPI